MLVYFFLLGFLSIISQAVLLREIINITYGNEIFYAVGLGLWLLFTGIGSFLGNKCSCGACPAHKKTRHSNARGGGPVWPPALYLPLTILYLPLITIGVRALTAEATITGELPPLLYSLAITAAALSIPSISLGYLFTAGVQFFKAKLNTAYLAETLGIFVGGILFSFIIAQTSFPLPAGLNKKSLKALYPQIEQVTNSKQQQIVTTKEGSQSSIYLSGKRAFSTGQTAENEQLAGLILSLTNNAENILSTGNPQLTNQLSRWGGKKSINYIESDCKLLSLIEENLDNSVSSVNSDILKHLKEKQGRYDLVVFDLPQPASLLINRLYTQEFYSLAEKSLVDGGSFITLFYFPTNYQSREVLNMGQSIYQTFNSVFENNTVLVLEDQLLLISSTGKDNTFNTKKISETYPSFTESYLNYQLTKPTRAQVVKNLKTSKEQINTATRPISFLYQSLFWLTTFSPLSLRAKVDRGSTLALIGGVFALWVILKSKKENRTAVVVGISSFILISLQSVLIYLFQTRFGNLYSQIAMLFSLVLLGMGGGIYFVEKRGGVKDNLLSKPVIYLPISLALFFLSNRGVGDQPCLWWLLAIGLGLCGGIVFATNANRTKGSAAKLYTADLIGAGLGAFFTGTLLFPTLGLVKLLIFLTALSIISLI